MPATGISMQENRPRYTALHPRSQRQGIMYGDASLEWVNNAAVHRRPDRSGMAHTLHMRIWRMSLYLYRYIPVSWPTCEKVYCRPSANWKESTLPSRNCASKPMSTTRCCHLHSRHKAHFNHAAFKSA